MLAVLMPAVVLPRNPQQVRVLVRRAPLTKRRTPNVARIVGED